jgi:putative transposase
LTFKLRHDRDFSAELTKARKVAEYAIEHRSRSSADVKHIGLKSMIANQILRKYGNDRRAKTVKNVVLIVPGQGIKYDSQARSIKVPCIKLELDAHHLPWFDKVNQIELDHESAFVTVTINEPPLMEVKQWIGIDRNTTGHVAVVSSPSSGKVWKLGKQCQHIHNKYKDVRRKMQKQGRYKEVKELGNRENRIVRDINHKISRKKVDIAVHNACGIKMEELDGIRNNRKQASSFRYSLHSRSFYQLQTMIEYKAKLLGVPVAYIAPQYTSQLCSRCGLLGVRNGKDFSCPHCGHVDHADASASFNIALRPSLEESVGRFGTDSDVPKGRIDAPQEATL